MEGELDRKDVLKTWKSTEWRCIQNEDAMGLLLGLKIIHSLCFAWMILLFKKRRRRG